jgi:hypothetical protein
MAGPSPQLRSEPRSLTLHPRPASAFDTTNPNDGDLYLARRLPRHEAHDIDRAITTIIDGAAEPPIAAFDSQQPNTKTGGGHRLPSSCQLFGKLAGPGTG